MYDVSKILLIMHFNLGTLVGWKSNKRVLELKLRPKNFNNWCMMYQIFY